MEVITSALEERGFSWAYRTVDTLAFGLPQRRKRIVIVAARKSDPRTVLFADEAGERYPRCPVGEPRGFYWTEGRVGIGWARNAVPPLKGGSGVGIPSSPAIWFPERRFIGTLDIRDAERLQGFRAGWTKPAAEDERSERIRWRLVGNAVSVPVAAWIARRLIQPGEYDASNDREVDPAGRWPPAAWGAKGHRYTAEVSDWPVRTALSRTEFLPSLCHAYHCRCAQPWDSMLGRRKVRSLSKMDSSTTLLTISIGCGARTARSGRTRPPRPDPADGRRTLRRPIPSSPEASRRMAATRAG